MQKTMTMLLWQLLKENHYQVVNNSLSTHVHKKYDVKYYLNQQLFFSVTGYGLLASYTALITIPMIAGSIDSIAHLKPTTLVYTTLYP